MTALVLLGLLAPRAAHAGDLAWHSLPRLAPPAEATLIECQRQAESYGDGEGPSYLDAHCFQDLFDSAAPSCVRQSEDRNLVAAGRGNALLVRTLISDESGLRFTDAVIAGRQTGIASLRAVSIDGANREIAAIDGQSGRVLVFDARVPGNVAPARELRASALSDPSAVAVAAVDGELWVGNNGDASLRAFARTASSSGSGESAKDPQPLRVIRGARTQLLAVSAIAVDSARREVYVADPVAHQVLVFDARADGDVAPLRALRGLATQLDRPQALSLPLGTDRLQVFNGDRRLLEFPRAADGSVPPTGP